MQTLVSIPPFTDPSAVVRIAVTAEAAGWDGVFLWDHLRWTPSARQDVHDPWVLLGAIATRTERVRLGTLVTPLARRRPWIVAKEVTTLDHLSDGRVVLGVGLGEPAEADFGDFGDPSDARERASVLDDGLAVLDALLRGGPVDHHGPHFSVRTELRPRPRQRPRPPIWVAGVAPHRRPLARARRYDGFVPIGPRDLLRPEDLATYLGPDLPSGWDLVASWAPGVLASEYAAVGVTWLVESTWPETGWAEELEQRVRRGPDL